jgi:hypothetical protein
MGGSGAAEVLLDIFNVANLIDSHWGRADVRTQDDSLPLLNLVGHDTGAGRGVYTLQLPKQAPVDLAATWRMQLAMRLTF